MSNNIDSLLKNSDSFVAEILNNALSDKEVTAKEGVRLYNTAGIDFHLVGLVADEIRKRRVGDTVTYVVNRNINFTNVCIKQCGFCAFSRDFREEEGYFLPTEEIVRRAKEALTDAPDDVKEEFQDQINVFGGQFDGYVPTGSVVSVSARRAIVAATAVIFAMPAPVTRRK